MKKRACYVLCMVGLGASVVFSGCGTSPSMQAGKATPVKAMKVIQQDAALSYEYAGQIKGKDEIKVQAKVSGNVVEKYVSGGQYVHAGQALYKIDGRQYQSAVLSAQATLAQSEATLNNARIDLERDQKLLGAEAVSEQTVTTQESSVRQYEAAADSNRALLKKAQEDFDDTVIYAPIDGHLDVNDVAVGTYVAAGSTTLVTIGSVNPVFVQFDISENDYLKFMALKQGLTGANAKVSLTLSNGQEYPLSGSLAQFDRSLVASDGTNKGALSVKAIFENPDNVLLPGMFARVKVSGDVIPQAILIPQRAVQQLLDKSFVITVDGDNKSQSRAVTLGDKIGSYWVVTDGLTADDTVVVEGLTKLQPGVDLDVTMVTAADLNLSMDI